MENAKIAYELSVLFDKKITSYYRDTFKGTLGQTQLEVLNHLYKTKESKVQDIANELNIPKQHISKILLRFQEINLVKCIPDPTDRRAKLFSLSERGLLFIEEHISKSNKHFEELLQTLNETEQTEMIASMKAMVKILKKL